MPPPDFEYTSQGSTEPYYCPNVEQITEPDNPFAPRLDVVGQDREYSNETSTFLEQKPLDTKCKVQDKTSNYPFMNGYTDYNAPWQTSENKKMFPPVRCAVVPVDILSFRSEAFDNCISQRIAINTNEYLKEWFYSGSAPDPQDIVTGAGFEPPCSTRWDEDDAGYCPTLMSIQQCCHIIVKDVVPANFLKMRTCDGLRNARANDEELQGELGGTPDSPVYTITDDEYSDDEQARWMDEQINKDVCEDDAPPEYHFNYWIDEPFTDDFNEGKLIGYNMPYMRWWDTGVSAGNSVHGGDFVNTMGGFDAIIGVGREERTPVDTKQANKIVKDLEEEGETVDTSHLDLSEPEQPSQIGRIGGWAQLKEHEMWTIHRSNLFCVGRYEKLFKPGGAEDLMLFRGGSAYNNRHQQTFSWPLAWRGYVTDSHEEDFQSLDGVPLITDLDNALPGDIIRYTVNGLPQIAYVAEIGGLAKPYTGAGFDLPLAKGSESIPAVFDPVDNRYELGKPFEGEPIGTPLHPTRIMVFTWDQNKFPDAAGSSVGWGMGPERTIYKDYVPEAYRNDICDMTLRALTDPVPGVTVCREGVELDAFNAGMCMAAKCMPSCEDPEYSACMLPPDKNNPDFLQWDVAKIYRPRLDVQSCVESEWEPTGGLYAFDMQEPWEYDLSATYAWPGAPVTPAGNVITQDKSGLVDSNLWAACVNNGYDPPLGWRSPSGYYSGAGTGAIIPTHLCGPKWHQTPEQNATQDVINEAAKTGCTAAGVTDQQYKFFPTKYIP